VGRVSVGLVSDYDWSADRILGVGYFYGAAASQQDLEKANRYRVKMGFKRVLKDSSFINLYFYLFKHVVIIEIKLQKRILEEPKS